MRCALALANHLGLFSQESGQKMDFGVLSVSGQSKKEHSKEESSTQDTPTHPPTSSLTGGPGRSSSDRNPLVSFMIPSPYSVVGQHTGIKLLESGTRFRTDWFGMTQTALALLKSKASYTRGWRKKASIPKPRGFDATFRPRGRSLNGCCKCRLANNITWRLSTGYSGNSHYLLKTHFGLDRRTPA